MPSNDPLCRLCLCPSRLLSSLFVDDRAQKLKDLTSIEIYESDPLTDICVDCSLNLNLAHKICQKMKQADEKLREIWASQSIQETVVNIKTENACDDVYEEMSIEPSVTEPVDCMGSTSCMVCGDKLDRKYIHQHLTSHFEHSKTCIICNQTFSNCSDYTDHLLHNHGDRQEYKCEKPDVAFSNESMDEAHLNTAAIEKSENEVASAATKEIVQIKSGQKGPFVCDECGKVFLKRDQFRHHTHAKKQCRFCHKLVGVRNLNRHLERHRVTGRMGELRRSKGQKSDEVRTRVNSAPRYKCDKCRRVFKRDYMRDLHMKVYHDEMENSEKKPSLAAPKTKQKVGPPFVCEECNKTFATNRQFRCHTHVKLPCPICSKLLGERNLRRHIESHTDPQKTCDLCEKKFKNSDGLRCHKYYAHVESRYKCDRCDRVFQRKHARAYHIKRDHDDSPPDFVCDICGKKFLAIRHLTIHKKTHRDLRPFGCEFCEKRYTSKQSLQTHIRKHTFEAPYKCEFCADSFPLKASLKTHLRSKHKVEEVITCHCKTCGRGFATDMALLLHKRRQVCSKWNTSTKEEPVKVEDAS